MILNSPTATRIFQVIKQIFLYVFPLIFITLIGLKLKKIGWHALIHALPTNPVFYALQIPAFFLLPLTEKMIFRLLLGAENSFLSSFCSASGPEYQCAGIFRRDLPL